MLFPMNTYFEKDNGSQWYIGIPVLFWYHRPIVDDTIISSYRGIGKERILLYNESISSFNVSL